MRTTPEAITRFWLEAVGPAGWFASDSALDAEIARRFGLAARMARLGAFRAWAGDADAALALLILLDQFPRNLHRGAPLAFAADPRARRVARAALARGFDLARAGDARLLFLLPFEHSESLADQDRAVRLVAARLPARRDYLRHARAHRDVIRRFGRFPFRNDALARPWTEAERAWVEAGGYLAELARQPA